MPNNKINLFAKFLTSGEVEHAYNLTRDILIKNGMKIGIIPDSYNKKLFKLIKHCPEGVSYA